jgi:hypothetical protein
MEVIPQDSWGLNIVMVILQVKLILQVNENETNYTVDLWLLRPQILAMQKAYDNGVSPATIVKNILDEFKGFNPFKLVRFSFWYCSPVFFSVFYFLVECHTVQRLLVE